MRSYRLTPHGGARACWVRSPLLALAVVLSLATLLGGLPLMRTAGPFLQRRATSGYAAMRQPSRPCDAAGSRWLARLEVDDDLVAAAVAEAATVERMQLQAGNVSGQTMFSTVKVVFLIHVWNPERADAVISHWARPRCLSLLADRGRAPRAQVSVVVQYFSASAAMTVFDWKAVGVDRNDVLFLPISTLDADRTATALREVTARHPDASWVFKGDDDTFVHVGRLARVLLAHDASKPLLLGRADHEWGRFASGGAGYALSRAALGPLLSQLGPFMATYGKHEDVMIAECLRQTVSQDALRDVPGFNWHLPENLLSRASFRDIDARATPITYHYVTPARMAAMTQPQVPPTLVQVWPFDVGSPDTFSPSEMTRFHDNARSCERAAASAGLSYRLVNIRDIDLAAAYSVGYLDAFTREFLYALNIAYLEGGIILSVSTACDTLALQGLMRRLVAAAPTQREQFLDPVSSNDFGATSGHIFLCSPGDDIPCAVMAATQFNHNVFRLLAGLTRKIVRADASLFNNKFFGEFNIAAHWALFADAPMWRNVSEDVRSPTRIAILAQELQIPLLEL